MLKYDTCNFLLNTGTLLWLLFILIIRILICFVAWILTKTCYRKSNKVYVFYNNLQKKLFWGEILAFFIGGFIEFYMSSYIATQKPIAESTFSDSSFELKNGEVLSFYGSIISILILVMILCSSIWIVFINYEKLDEIHFKIKFEELYSGIQYKSKL